GGGAARLAIAVDQAEELFAAADAEESRRFVDLIARILDPERSAQRPDAPKLDAPPILLWTIPADSLDALLAAADAARLTPPQPFLLPPTLRLFKIGDMRKVKQAIDLINLQGDGSNASPQFCACGAAACRPKSRGSRWSPRANVSG